MSGHDHAPLRAVLIGCGEHASVVIHQSISFAYGVQMVACCDIDRVRAERTGARFGITPYVDLEEMLDREKADVAFVVSYPPVHPKLVASCLGAGLHVFVEKPLGVELSEISEVRALEQSSGMHVGVGFMKRFNPSYVRLRDAVATSEFGAPSLFYGKFAGGNRPRSRDLFRVGAIHLFDLARFVVGEIRSIYATKYEIAEGQISVAVNGVFENGCVVDFALSSLGTWTAKWAEYVEVIGNRNIFAVDNCRTCYWQKAPVVQEGGSTTQMVKEEPLPAEYSEPNYSNVSELRFQAVSRNGYLPLIETFVRDIREERQETPGTSDAEEALRIALAVEDSLDAGKVISIQQSRTR